MGGKPLGQLEIDEHAAEAGIVTRLEAFVDTIKGFAHSAGKQEETGQRRYLSEEHFLPSLMPRKPLLFPGWRRTLSL